MKAQTFFYALPIAASILCSAIAAENGITANPNKAGDGVQVGVGGRDGVTISGGEAYVTRNGATEKLSKDLVLPSGVIAQPDGTVILKDGTKATLRASQLLTFEGKVMELPPSVNDNPDPRPNTQNRNGAAGGTQGTGQANAGFGTGQNPSFRMDRGNNQAGGGSVFLDSSGTPFMGTLGADGTIVTSDGRSVAFDGTVRAVTFGANGTPALGTINRNGSITQADGSITYADGSVRTADGQVITPPRDAQGNVIRSGLPQNTTNQPLQNADGTPANTNANSANPNVPATNNNNNNTGTGAQTNSPNNAGTVNRTNTSPGNASPNNTGTVNNPNSTATGNTGTTNAGGTNATGNAATGNTTNGTNRATGGNQTGGSSSSRPSGARNGGSSGGTGTGSGASGAGGASGGAGGGASR